VIACIFLNYFFIKLFVEQFQIYPTVSKILTTVIIVTFSYLTQKHFTFKSAYSTSGGLAAKSPGEVK